MPPLFCSAYLPPVSMVRMMVSSARVLVEQYDSYHKQTYRNRCVIAVADGVQTLTIPVVKSDSPKQLMRDVRISDHGNWRHLHWNALASAYMNSPFFMYYEDDLRPIYEKRQTFLIDFNQELLHTVLALAGINTEISLTDEFTPVNDACGLSDFRWMVEPDAQPEGNLESYYQVFRQKNGFIPNLSVADLLFNLGPEALLYLTR